MSFRLPVISSLIPHVWVNQAASVFLTYTPLFIGKHPVQAVLHKT